MRLLDALKYSTEYLEEAGVEDAFADAEILTFHAAGADRLAAYMENPEITKELLSEVRRLMRRRAKGEPLQYIVGHVDFLGLTIRVGKGVLIPRPETELLVEEAIKQVRGQGSGLGAGEPRLSLKSLIYAPAAAVLHWRSQRPCPMRMCTVRMFRGRRSVSRRKMPR